MHVEHIHSQATAQSVLGCMRSLTEVTRIPLCKIFRTDVKNMLVISFVCTCHEQQLDNETKIMIRSTNDTKMGQATGLLRKWAKYLMKENGMSKLWKRNSKCATWEVDTSISRWNYDKIFIVIINYCEKDL